MKQVRMGVFETNSSSTHSLVMCNELDFEDFKSNKKFIFDSYSYRKRCEKEDIQCKKLFTIEELVKLPEVRLKEELLKVLMRLLNGEELNDDIEDALGEWSIKTYTAFGENLEYFEDSFISVNGDKVIAFGEYGYDG
jgi:hypothetical protein